MSYTPEIIADRARIYGAFQSQPFAHSPSRVLRIEMEGEILAYLVATTSGGTHTVGNFPCHQNRRDLIKLFDHEFGRAEVPISFCLYANGEGVLSATLF